LFPLPHASAASQPHAADPLEETHRRAVPAPSLPASECGAVTVDHPMPSVAQPLSAWKSSDQPACTPQPVHSIQPAHLAYLLRFPFGPVLPSNTPRHRPWRLLVSLPVSMPPHHLKPAHTKANASARSQDARSFALPWPA